MDSLSAQALALFDFDGTLIKGDSILAFIRLGRRLKAFSSLEYAAICFTGLRYLVKNISAEQAKARALRFLTQLSPDRKMALEMAFALECLLPAVYPEARAEIQRCREEGKLPVLLSASTENYMQHIAPALGFEALLCTSLSQDGRLGPNCKGQEKINRLNQWLLEKQIQPDWASSSAYGDSLSDLPMLQSVGYPVLVNPKKKLLKAAPEMPLVKWGKK